MAKGRRWASLMMVGLAFALLAASCGDDDEPAPTAAPATQPPATDPPATGTPEDF